MYGVALGLSSGSSDDVQGRVALEKQTQQVTAALQDSFEVTLGGAGGAVHSWGRCLAVRADGLADLRSQLGNALAEKSRDAGLRAVGVVAYREVRMCARSGQNVRASVCLVIYLSAADRPAPK